jgi:hypothetical protein
VGNEWDQESGGGTPHHMTPAQHTLFHEHTVGCTHRADPQANVYLKNLATDGKVRRYLLNTADRAFDDKARLQTQPMQKVSKGEGLLSFRLEPWGLTMISIAKF